MLPPEQQKELELALWNYLEDRGYTKAASDLSEESQLLKESGTKRNEDRVLERKWFTIVKLQSKILELERKLSQSEEIIAKSVRTLTIPDESNGGKVEGLETPVVKMTKVYKGHKDTVTCLVIHESEPYFASGSSDATIRLVDYELQSNITILKGHTHSINCLAWAKEELVSGSSDMAIKIWRSGNKTNAFDLKEFYCQKTLLGHEHIISGLICLEDTDLTISVSRDKSIRIWDRSNGFCRRTITDTHDDWVRCCDANKKYLITSGNDKRLFVFDLAQILNFDSHGNSTNFTNMFPIHDNYVDGLAIYKNGSLGDDENIAVTCSRDKTIGVWNFLNGNCLVRLTGHENWVKSVALFEEYNLLLSVGDDKTLRIWDLKRRKQVYVENNSHDHFVSCICLQKQYRVVLTGSVDKTSKIWKILNSSSSEFISSAYN